MAKKQVSGRFGESVLTVRRMIQGVVDMDRASVIIRGKKLMCFSSKTEFMIENALDLEESEGEDIRITYSDVNSILTFDSTGPEELMIEKVITSSRIETQQGTYMTANLGLSKGSGKNMKTMTIPATIDVSSVKKEFISAPIEEMEALDEFYSRNSALFMSVASLKAKGGAIINIPDIPAAAVAILASNNHLILSWNSSISVWEIDLMWSWGLMASISSENTMVKNEGDTLLIYIPNEESGRNIWIRTAIQRPRTMSHVIPYMSDMAQGKYDSGTRAIVAGSQLMNTLLSVQKLGLTDAITMTFKADTLSVTALDGYHRMFTETMTLAEPVETGMSFDVELLSATVLGLLGLSGKTESHIVFNFHPETRILTLQKKEVESSGDKRMILMKTL